MPITPTYPGVYIEEIPSGVRTITGVSTSVAMFIGRAKSGPLFESIQCLNAEDFNRNFTFQHAGTDLPRAVKLFFMNGGKKSYVMRIADSSAAPATLTLHNEAGSPTVQIIARSAGLLGNDIRVSVNYNTPQPDSTFNLEVFRLAKQSDGTRAKDAIETYLNLSMDPDHPRYARDIINQNSKLIKFRDLQNDTPPVMPSDPPTALTPLAGNGVSISGFAISARTITIFKTQIQSLLTPSQSSFRLGIGGNTPTLIDLSTAISSLPAVNAAFQSNLEILLTNTINPQLPPGQSVAVTFIDGPTGPNNEDNTSTKLLIISGIGADVFIEPAATNDLSRVLMLGTAQDGIEITRSADRRPAPTAVVFSLLSLSSPPNDFTRFGSIKQDAFNAIRIDGIQINLSGDNKMLTSSGLVEARLYQDKNATDQNNGRKGILEKFRNIASAIQATRISNLDFKWTAEVWGTRLALIAAGTKPESSVTTLEALLQLPAQAANAPLPPATVVQNVFGTMIQNVRFYTLGISGTATFFSGGVSGNDGGPPKSTDYETAYKNIDQQVDLFNLLILPKDHDHSEVTTASLWGPASEFCQKRRAFLLIDPPSGWTDSQKAVDPSVGVNTLRVGLVKDHSAVFYPCVKIFENGKEEKVGPGGAIAGLMARIDSTRGVWKASAGTEADLRGISGLEYNFSDDENGVLNPKAVNTLRVFPNGIVSWGARTMDGDDSFSSEYKYIPIRRTALFIEESLYRGLKWVIFEPNDEPLWSQIRLNVGAFMHDLFRQGAFQGQSPKDAYFVRCDSETTTENDRNLGRVNIWVGFAPLKPAEFVIIYLQQMAGQIQV